MQVERILFDEKGVARGAEAGPMGVLWNGAWNGA